MHGEDAANNTRRRVCKLMVELNFPDVPDPLMALLLNSLDAGYWQVAHDGSVEHVSPPLLALYGVIGITASPLLDRVRACIDPGDLAALDRVAADGATHGQCYAQIIHIRRESDGERRVLRVRGRTLTDEPGGSTTVGTHVDITDSQSVLDALHEARAQRDVAEQLAGVGSWSWELATQAVHWSQETYRILGVSPHITPSFDLVMAKLVEPEREAELRQRIAAALDHDAPYEVEAESRREDGATLITLTRGRVERDATGAPLRMVGSIQDVTAVCLAERALVEREARFRTLAEASPTGVFLTEATGTPTYANQRLLDWFGLTLEGFAAGQWLDRIHPDDRHMLAAETAQNDSRREPWEASYRIVLNEQVRWIQVRTAPVRGDDVSVRGHVGSVQDVTAERFAAEERERLQGQLQQARKLESIGLLAGGVAHDFNNLLVGILANASLARDALPPELPLADLLADIERSAQRAAELTRQLLSYAGRGHLERAQVDIVALVAELPTLLGARVPPTVSLQVRHQLDTAWVTADATQLRQMIMNLVTNAVDALATGAGSVTVTLSQAWCTRARLAGCVLGASRADGDYVIIEVADTGCGMTPDVIERMFDPFFTTKGTGRGLGLAATLGVLNSHLSAVEVQSQPRYGTTIRLLVPLVVVGPASEMVDAPERRAATGAGTVLLVDDDTSARTAARRVLQRAGFQVVEAGDGQEALVRFAEWSGRLACVVLDVSMPVMSGDACLREIRRRDSLVPVLLFSGYDAEEVAAALVARGDARFLQKPFTATELLRAVGDAVGSKGETRTDASGEN